MCRRWSCTGHVMLMGSGLTCVSIVALLLPLIPVLLDDITRLVSKAFGSSKCINKALCIDGPHTELEGFVKKGITGFRENPVGELIQVVGAH